VSVEVACDVHVTRRCLRDGAFCLIPPVVNRSIESNGWPHWLQEHALLGAPFPAEITEIDEFCFAF
jgi:hypothetical protein